MEHWTRELEGLQVVIGEWNAWNWDFEGGGISADKTKGLGYNYSVVAWGGIGQHILEMVALKNLESYVDSLVNVEVIVWLIAVVSWKGRPYIKKEDNEKELMSVCVLTQSYPTLWDPVGHSLPGSFVHGLLQARILEWIAIPSSRGSS